MDEGKHEPQGGQYAAEQEPGREWKTSDTHGQDSQNSDAIRDK